MSPAYDGGQNTGMTAPLVIAEQGKEIIPPGYDVAVAIAVAPERMDEAIAAVPPDQLLGTLWWVGELRRRLAAAEKGLHIEAAVAMEHGELPSIDIEVNGHRYQYRMSSKNEFSDVPLLVQELVNLGLKPYTVGRSVGYLKITTLQEDIARLPEAEREIAYGLLDEHRTKAAGSWGLIDLTAAQQYRKGKR